MNNQRFKSSLIYFLFASTQFFNISNASNFNILNEQGQDLLLNKQKSSFNKIQIPDVILKDEVAYSKNTKKNSSSLNTSRLNSAIVKKATVKKTAEKNNGELLVNITNEKYNFIENIYNKKSTGGIVLKNNETKEDDEKKVKNIKQTLVLNEEIKSEKDDKIENKKEEEKQKQKVQSKIQKKESESLKNDTSNTPKSKPSSRIQLEKINPDFSDYGVDKDSYIIPTKLKEGNIKSFSIKKEIPFETNEQNLKEKDVNEKIENFFN